MTRRWVGVGLLTLVMAGRGFGQQNKPMAAEARPAFEVAAIRLTAVGISAGDQ